MKNSNNVLVLFPSGYGKICPPLAGNTCDPGAYWGQILIAEAIGTFVFCSVILAIISYNTDDGPFTAFAIASTLYGCIAIASKLSGGCLNPAIAIV